MSAEGSEAEARHGDQIPDGARHEHHARRRQRRDTCPDVDRDAARLAAGHLALARVDAGADLETERAHGVDDGTRAADRPRRPVEHGQYAVPGRVDLATATAPEFAPNEREVPLEELAPGAVAELRDPVGRAHDVGEEHGSEYAVGLRATPDAGEELLDLVEERFLISHPRDVVRAGQLHELRARDSARDEACLLDLHLAVTGAMQH